LNRIRLKKYLHKGSRKNQERKNLIWTINWNRRNLARFLKKLQV
jgi:hypothetical protein